MSYIAGRYHSDLNVKENGYLRFSENINAANIDKYMNNIDKLRKRLQDAINFVEKGESGTISSASLMNKNIEIAEKTISIIEDIFAKYGIDDFVRYDFSCKGMNYGNLYDYVHACYMYICGDSENAKELALYYFYDLDADAAHFLKNENKILDTDDV